MTSPDGHGRCYGELWETLGTTFPSLKRAPSTEYYAECEHLLYEECFPELKNRVLLKTDLWDEAKNTEILRWAAEQGVRPVGIDISLAIVQQAREVLNAHRPWLVVADVRALPFRADAFDLLYSMGTIEHFAEYRVAIHEVFRVLKGGGRAIVGVPNKLDPFLRPLMVHVLNRLGLYAYGMEKSFTLRGLGRLLASAGFRVRSQTGILFLPGWLRMLDLWCHTRIPSLTAVTRWLVHPFARVYRRARWIRRHGYLIACVVEKPVRWAGRREPLLPQEPRAAQITHA